MQLAEAMRKSLKPAERTGGAVAPSAEPASIGTPVATDMPQAGADAPTTAPAANMERRKVDTESREPVDPALLTLYRFVGTGKTIEFAAPWSEETLFLVPGPSLVPPLLTEGIGRGRIWTAVEILDLL